MGVFALVHPSYASDPTTNSKAILSPGDLGRLLSFLIERFDVYGPVAKGKQVVFGSIHQPGDLRLDYVTTILPPKKFFYAPFETVFHFHRELGITAQQGISDRGKVLFGIHPCDVAALGLLDRVMEGGYNDTVYQAKRQQTLIVALNCNSAGEHCFCTSFGTGPEATRGFDLAITNLGERFLLEAGTPVGAEMIEILALEPAETGDLWEKESRMRKARERIPKRMHTERLPRLLNQNFDHPVWAKLNERCLSCGACTVACPTCYCFNVWDQVNLDLTTGQRKMVWDSCQLVDFGEVAMGHNFRRDRTARVKQRVYHKLSYFNTQYGDFGCVGCGRCTEACIKHIDLVAIVNEIGG